MDAKTELYDGTPVEVGGKTYLVPPLSFGRLKKYLPFIQELTSGTSKLPEEEQLTMSSDLIYSCMVRNYPDMTQEKMEDEILTVANMQDFIMAIVKSNNLVRSKTHTGKKLAESPASVN